jgi:hypothetical protein
MLKPLNLQWLSNVNWLTESSQDDQNKWNKSIESEGTPYNDSGWCIFQYRDSKRCNVAGY